MTKLSIVASRALVGFGVVALTSTATFAAQVVSDNAKFQAEFENNNGNWTNKNDTTKGTGNGVDIGNATWSPAPIAVPASGDTPAHTLPLNSLTIDTSKEVNGQAPQKGTINVNGRLGSYNKVQGEEVFYGVKLIGDTVTKATDGILNIGRDSSIEGAVTHNGAINVKNGATLGITGNVTAATNSSVNIDNSRLNVTGNVSSSGAFNLANNASMNINGSFTGAAAHSLNFTDGGIIRVNQTRGNDGKIIPTSGRFTFNSTNANNTISYTTTKRQLADDVVIANAQAGFWKGTAAADELKAGEAATNTFLSPITPTASSTDKISALLSNPNLLAGTGLENTTFSNKVDNFNYSLGLSSDNKTLSILVASKNLGITKNANETAILNALSTALDKTITSQNTAIGANDTVANSARKAIANKIQTLNTAITSNNTAIGTKAANGNPATELEKNIADAQAILDDDSKTEAEKATAQKSKEDAEKRILALTQENATNTNLVKNLTTAKEELTARQALLATATTGSLKQKLDALVGTNNAGVAQDVLLRVVDTREVNGVRINANILTALVSNAADLRDTSVAVANTGNLNEGLGILSSFARSTSINDNDKLNVITHNRFFRDTRDAGRSATTFANASTSALSVMNVSNDMALSGRIAKANNPYNQKLAAIGSDAAYPYYENYTASVWANAFGGSNIIDGNSGGVYGITLGIDGNVTDNLLLGAYFSYADSTLKDDMLKQESDNFQIGLYSLVKLPQDWEIGLKGFGQFGSADQTRHNGAAGTSTTDFDTKFFGLSGNLGKVIGFENGLYLKPFVGLNYYYSFTDDYTEKGATGGANLHAHSNTNNSFSADIGLEVRKYFSNNSYIYATPKIEQYLVNNGDDFVARFVGSDTTFRIDGDDKKRTYGQLVLGANVELTEALALQLGVGAKQILANKADDKNETYLSGNLGLKYKF